jgi:hypothetical protein
MLQFGTPFGYLFQQRGWFKQFAIASLLTYTLIGAAPVMGWMIEITRRVAKGITPVIPVYNDWKLYWKLGGKFALVNAVWLFPLLLAVILLYLPLLFTNRIPPEATLGIFASVLCCVMAFLFIYTILYVFFTPAMMVVLATDGSAGKAIHPIHLLKSVRLQFMGYLLVFLIIGLGLMNIVAVLAVFTLFLLLPPLLVYAGVVTAHYAGQLAASTSPAAEME